MQKILSMFIGAATIFSPFAFSAPAQAVATNSWDATGNYVVEFEYLGNEYSHDVNLVQDELGNLTGDGGSPAGSNTYTWELNSGTVVGNNIALTANYTATPDAVTPQTTLDVEGVIAPDGTMSGTWSDNYNEGERSGVWNTTSGEASEVEDVVHPAMVTVTIEKFVQNLPATAGTANNSDFPMSSTWDAENIGAGTGEYTLSETNATPYQATTVEMTSGADYATNEILSGDVVAAQCSEGKPFELKGYTTGHTRAEAMTATPSLVSPEFTDLNNDKYVIVWNTDCSIDVDGVGGEINGEVISGDGILEVTSIEIIDNSATANGSFGDGWEYVFHITAPTSEQDLAMKFSDWLQTGDAGIIPVANNMRISSAQADNGGATILLTASNIYSTPVLHMTEDLDLVTDGRQVEITVEVAVPAGTPDGSYTTTYGVQSN